VNTDRRWIRRKINFLIRSSCNSNNGDFKEIVN
jgi:hypothetical protein